MVGGWCVVKCNQERFISKIINYYGRHQVDLWVFFKYLILLFIF